MDIWFCSDNDYKQNYLHSEMYSCINPSDDDPARHWLQHLPTTGRFLNRPPSCIFPIPTIYHYHILPSSMLFPKSKTLLHCTSHAMILMDCRIIFRFSTSISKDQTLMDILNYNCRVCITSSFNDKLKTLPMSVPVLLPLLVSECRWRSCRSRRTSRPSPCRCRRHLVSSWTSSRSQQNTNCLV